MARSRSRYRFLIIFILAFALISRIPAVPEEIGIDSYRTHHLTKSIIDEQYIVWNSNLLSLFGLFPYSYPSLEPLLLAVLSVISGLSISYVILLMSIFAGTFGTYSFFLFVKSLFREETHMIYFSTIIYCLSPIFFRFSYWTASTRGLFMALLPLYFLFLVRSIQSKKIKYMLITSMIASLLLMTHRMGIITFIIPIVYISGNFTLTRLISYKKINSSRFVSIIAIISVGLIAIQFISTEPFNTFKHTYIRGKWFSAGTEADYKAGNLNDLVIIINMIIDYVSRTGLILLFSGIGFLVITNRIYTRRRKEDILLLSSLIVSLPFLLNGKYISVFFCPIYIIIGCIGFFRVISAYIRQRSIRIFATASLIIISLLLSVFMNLNWMHNFDSRGTLPWIKKTTTYSEKFLDDVNKDRYNCLISDSLLNQRMRSISDTVFMPANFRQDLGLILYGYIDINNISITFKPLGFLTPTKSFVDIKRITIHPRKDWEKLITSSFDEKYNQDIRDYYSIGFVLEKNSMRYVRPHWDLYEDLKREMPKIYTNDDIGIWRIRK